jgi:hypothetical protein
MGSRTWSLVSSFSDTRTRITSVEWSRAVDCGRTRAPPNKQMQLTNGRSSINDYAIWHPHRVLRSAVYGAPARKLICRAFGGPTSCPAWLLSDCVHLW